MARNYLRNKLLTVRKNDIIFLSEEKDKCFIVEENHKNFDYFKTSFITTKVVNGQVYEITNFRNIKYEEVDEVQRVSAETGEPGFYYINFSKK